MHRYHILIAVTGFLCMRYSAAAGEVPHPEIGSLEATGARVNYWTPMGERKDGRLIYKVDVLSQDGKAHVFAMDEAGGILDYEEAANTLRGNAEAQRRDFDLLGEEAVELIESGAIDVDEHVDAILYPLCQAPTGPVPPDPDDKVAVEDDVEAWKEYFGELRRVRGEAAGALETKLREESAVTVLERFGWGVHVAGSLRGVVAALNNSGGRSGSLLHPLLVQEESLADANIYIGMDAFRYGNATDFDGNTNGSQIRMGLAEQEGGNWPYTPTLNGGTTFRTAHTSCSVDADCGACGGFPANPQTGCRCIGGYCYRNHVTLTNSALNSFDDSVNPALPVGMPDGQVYFAGVTDPNFQSAVDWFSANDVRLMNISLAGISQLDRDEAVRLDRIAITNAAGNAGPSITTCASPNVICVGAYDTSNDVMANFSSCADFRVNGIPLDREQPDLVGPGVSLKTYTVTSGTPGWAGNTNGTSLASPIVLSAIAGIHDISKTLGGPRYYPTLEDYPELSKAVAMAASNVDVEAPATSFNSSSTDSCDGAGGLEADDLKEQWTSGRWSIRLWQTTDPDPLTWKSLSITAGHRFRAYLVWSRCPASHVIDIHADFDLRVYLGASQVASSTSYRGLMEVVDFTAAATGTYDVKLDKAAYSACAAGGGEYVALAWKIY